MNMVKKTSSITALLLFSACTSMAATTLQTDDFANYNGAVDNQGNWHYQSATLNDAGFQLSGSPLDANVLLTSVSFIRDNSTSTTGQTYLAVLTNPIDLNSVVASSSNSLDINSFTQGTTMTWSFASDVISSSTLYYYAFYQDTSGNGSIGVGDTAVTARLAMVSGPNNPIAGSVRNAPSGGIASNDDTYIRITTDSIPEPSAAALLGIAGLALVARRRR